MSEQFFGDVPGPIPFGGLESTDPLSFKVYQPDRLVLGKRMEDQLRIAVCLWHSFNWPGSDVFGSGTFDRPWLAPGLEPMAAAAAKIDSAFEFLGKLGIPFFCFHDRDVAPEGHTYAETQANLDAAVDRIAGHMERTGMRLLWGTANLFAHPRYAAGAATNPDPEVFAYAAAQVRSMLEATHRLGGVNYVLWGGREGYETLLNTDLRREDEQLGRFLTMVAEHKHKIGFQGTLLIEPKPMEPTKHQYDFDAATVHGFLVRHGLAGEYKLNLETNHATLAGHSFQHEVATRWRTGMFGSVDANRGDYQNGWDTDQFPNSVDELSLALLEILRGGGFTTRRLQLRRQAPPPEHGSDRPVPCPYRRHGHPRALTPGRRGHDRRRPARPVAPRPLRGLARTSSGARSSPATRLLARSVRGSPRARSTRSPGRASRSCTRTSSTSTCGRWKGHEPPRGPAAAASRRREGHAMAYVLGIDVSTTATKAVLIDGAGAVVAVGASAYPFDVPRPLWSEQDPGLWWDATQVAIGSARVWPPASSGDDVVAIGLTGQMHGAVLLDEADRVLRPGDSVERPAHGCRMRR